MNPLRPLRFIDYVIFVPIYGLLWFMCFLGWHSWVWEPYLRVPYYGTGAWKCVLCRKVKVKP